MDEDRRSSDLSKKGKKPDSRPVAAGQLEAPDVLRAKAEGRRYVFTAAQNNTYVHKGFLAALKRFCKHRDAELIVAKFTYNKAGFQNKTKDDALWYDPKIVKYLRSESIEITPDLVFCGELNILPTAVNPLSGFENYNRNASSIIPHAKVQMRSIATMKYEPPKFLYTTGAVTQRNYIQQKAGQKASFHHVFGATYVEIDRDGDWFVRQLVAASDGHFYDLDERFSPTGVKRGVRVAGINWGDLHAECSDPEVVEGAFAANGTSMLDVLRPYRQFAHDLTDFRPRNHHGIKDPYFLATQFAAKSDSVREGLRSSSALLFIMDRPQTETIIVESNHDQALQRWLASAEGRMDPPNAEYWHYLNAHIHRSIRLGRPPAVFEFALREFGVPNRVQFLPEDASFEICRRGNEPGIECGMHGHRGPNGTRGSIANLRSVGKRANIGHSHSAAIIDGVYMAGVSAKLDLDYNKGPSSWSHSHIVTYANSKRAIVTMRGKKWRANG